MVLNVELLWHQQGCLCVISCTLVSCLYMTLCTAHHAFSETWNGFLVCDIVMWVRALKWFLLKAMIVVYFRTTNFISSALLTVHQLLQDLGFI